MKRYIKKVSTLGLLITLLGSPSHAKEQFPQFFVFGDSLSDAGNVILPGHQRLFPPPAVNDPTIAPEGGLVWSQAFAAKFGIPMIPSNQPNNPVVFSPGGNNFAWAGSMMTGNRNAVLSPDYNPFPDVPGQVTAYLANNQVNSRAIYSLWAGSNDIYNFIQTAQVVAAQPTGIPVFDAIVLAPLTNVGITLAAQLTRLSTLGARNLMAFNLADFGRSPLAVGAGIGALATGLVTVQNQNIATALSGLSFRVITIDALSLSNYILDNPGLFGIQNVVAPGPNGTHFFSADGLHPNANVSQMVGDAAFSVVQGPLYMGLIGDAALGQMGAYEQVIHASLGENREGDCKKSRWTPIIFGVYEYTARDKNGTAMPGYDAQNRQIILGGHYCLTSSLTLGGLVGYSTIRNTFTNNGGRFDMSQTRGVVFLNLTEDDFYGRADIHASFVDVPNIRRNILIGGFGFPAKAHTRGYTVGTLMEAGWWAYKTKQTHTGPVAQMSFQFGKVNGFNELDSAPGTNLIFWDQKPRAFTGGLGWEMRYKSDTFNSWARVMAMIEHRPSRFVDARFSTLTNTRFGMEVPKLKASPWAYVELGLGRMATERIQVTAGLSANLFRKMQEDTMSHSLSLMVKVAF